jgi:membrane dipeptidase
MRPANRLAIFLIVTSSLLVQSTKKPAAKHARMTPSQIHNSALVIDTHADTPQRLVDENYDLASPLNGGHWNIESARKGNLGVQFFSIWVEPKKNVRDPIKRAMLQIDAVHEQVKKHPHELMLALGTKDILAAHKQRKIAVLMGLEGGHAIEDSLPVLRDYYKLGVRYMTLTWANSTSWAQSSGDLPKPDPQTGKVKDVGMSDWGRNLVREMNRLGMIVDISHVSDRSYYNALTASRAPVIASHSSARAITDVPRNMTDEMLVQLTRNGGVAMVNFYCGFISNDYAKAREAQKPEREKALAELEKQYNDPDSKVAFTELQRAETQWAAKLPRPPLSALIDHIDHIAKVAGIDHVGIGSDLDGVTCTPEGIDSVADFPKITEALMARGYTAEQIRKILGGNLMRVFQEVERVAKEIQTEQQQDKRREVAPEQQ